MWLGIFKIRLLLNRGNSSFLAENIFHSLPQKKKNKTKIQTKEIYLYISICPCRQNQPFFSISVVSDGRNHCHLHIMEIILPHALFCWCFLAGPQVYPCVPSLDSLTLPWLQQELMNEARCRWRAVSGEAACSQCMQWAAPEPGSGDSCASDQLSVVGCWIS